jgi:CRISPR-associated endonuclease/helicase Cas3
VLTGAIGSLRRSPRRRHIEKVAAEAEAGYDVEPLIARRNKRGRPTIGTAPASVESVRLDPELRRELIERGQSEGTTPPN